MTVRKPHPFDRIIDSIEWVAALFVGIVAANIFLAVVLTLESRRRRVRILQATAAAVILVLFCSINVLTNLSHGTTRTSAALT